MNKFLYYKGLISLGSILNGNENVYLGIKPSGFHAGNFLTLVAYPLLLCEEMAKKGIEPKFNFFIFLNDWEQDALVGIDKIKYPFDIRPARTTLQYIDKIDSKIGKEVKNGKESIVRNLMLIKKKYKKVQIIPKLNSEMKNHPIMKKYLVHTMNNGGELAKLFSKYSNKPLYTCNQQYALAVCPKCLFAEGTTTYDNKKNTVIHYCKKCGSTTQNTYENFDYWFYHKPMAIPKLEIYKIDLCITGADHLEENDFDIRENLIKVFGANVKNFTTLYSPIVMGKDGKKMGKSNKNTQAPKEKILLKLAKSNNHKICLK